MTKLEKVRLMEARINVLESRSTANGRIIAKLKRKIRTLG